MAGDIPVWFVCVEPYRKMGKKAVTDDCYHFCDFRCRIPFEELTACCDDIETAIYVLAALTPEQQSIIDRYVALWEAYKGTAEYRKLSKDIPVVEIDFSHAIGRNDYVLLKQLEKLASHHRAE